MNYKEHIENALIYIEINLKTDLSLANLAKVSGYSEYHFLRVFKETTGLTPADYIRKRRLLETIRTMEKSNRSISDIAFEYGFNSKIAFKSDEEHIPNFWNKYNCKKLSAKLSEGKDVTGYGICVWNSERNAIDYYIGISSSDAKGDITGTVPISINRVTYAVFATPPTSHFNFVNMIHKTWEYIYSTWLPQSGYKRAFGHEFETYVESSRTFSEDIYIPIERT